MARVLGVSVSGFHAWRCRPPSAHAIADTALLKQIRTVHASSRETYGAPRVQAALKAGGEKHGRKRIARLMRAAGLVGASRRRRQWGGRVAPDYYCCRQACEHDPAWQGSLIAIDEMSEEALGRLFRRCGGSATPSDR